MHIVSIDSLKAEQIVNDAIGELCSTLNQFCIELKTRSIETTEAMLDYLETLDGLIVMLSDWNSQANDVNTDVLPVELDEELAEYLD